VAFAKPRALGGLSAAAIGRIAQLVEQLTLNQRVPGSSPGAPTKFLDDFRNAAEWKLNAQFAFSLHIAVAGDRYCTLPSTEIG
jgi:hypothetical protein